MSKRSLQKDITITAVAALTGAAAALLLAPKSGKETRADIKVKATKLKNKAQTELSHTKDKVDDNLHKARELKGRVSDALHDTAEHAKKEGKHLQAEAQGAKQDLKA